MSEPPKDQSAELQILRSSTGTNLLILMKKLARAEKTTYTNKFMNK